MLRYISGLEVTHQTAVPEVPSSIPGSDNNFCLQFCFVGAEFLLFSTNIVFHDSRAWQITKVVLKRVFFMAKCCTESKVDLKYHFHDVLGLLFANIQNGRQICVYLLINNK